MSLFYCCKKVFTHMNDWEKFNESSLLNKKDFSSHLNMEDNKEADDTHAEKFFKILK